MQLTCTFFISLSLRFFIFSILATNINVFRLHKKRIKIMRKIILISFVMLCFGFSKAQTSTTPDPRLLDVYSQEYLDANLENEIEYFNWFLDNSYFVALVGLEKAETLPYLYEIDKETKEKKNKILAIDEESFNPLLSSYEIFYNKESAYRIGNTGYVIAFYSQKKLTKNYNQYKNENQ